MLRAPGRAVKRNAHAILDFVGGFFLFKWRRLLFVVVRSVGMSFFL